MSELLQAPSRRLLFLIGLRGTGKTCVARLLADKLGWGWSDADIVLEQRAGRSIRKIFQDEGEASFRDQEVAVLEDLAARENHVVATGGGVVLRPENRARLGSGTVVWLTAPAEIALAALASGLHHRRAAPRPGPGRAALKSMNFFTPAPLCMTPARTAWWTPRCAPRKK